MSLDETTRQLIREASEGKVDLPDDFNQFTALYIESLRKLGIPSPLIAASAIAHYQSVTAGLSSVHRSLPKKKA